jgi:hypothetical protein
VPPPPVRDAEDLCFLAPRSAPGPNEYRVVENFAASTKTVNDWCNVQSALLCIVQCMARPKLIHRTNHHLHMAGMATP